MRLIVACDPNGGIGYQNKLPWSKIQGDLPRFKKLTTNGTVVMGRNTWDSLPKRPLANRVNVIVTSLPFNNLPADTHIVSAPEDAPADSWVIGGAKLIKSSWHLINEVHLSRTCSEYTCDTFIDLVKLEQEFWCVNVEKHPDHTYEIWRRK